MYQVLLKITEDIDKKDLLVLLKQVSSIVATHMKTKDTFQIDILPNVELKDCENIEPLGVHDDPETTFDAEIDAPKKEDDTIPSKVYRIIHEIVDYGGEINELTTLGSCLGMDSLDAIELVMKLEDEFQIEITDEEVNIAEITSQNSDRTVGDVISFVRKKIGY